MLQATKQYSVYQYDDFVPVADKPVDSSWKKLVQADKYALSAGIYYCYMIVFSSTWMDFPLHCSPSMANMAFSFKF